MKKQRKIEPAVKLGGGSFNITFVRSFESKEAFIEYEKSTGHISFTKDLDGYLSEIWDKCHQENELKTAKIVSEKVIEVKQTEQPETPEVKKVSTNKKATSKKE